MPGALSAETWEDALGDIAPEVDADTCKPYWTGEHPDYGMAVDGLLKRRQPPLS
ncbi:hypothetical protein [Parahaliea mediterranea]|uniref:Uncharacterized protein n=1 Tax=Parahaliea mediterranea TaxID=651086 RepID=A0A939INB2_9GAMM|nr:hypothetical protein [Parahaliea mediterranea]MBN7797928.1 hypothetical protein [Parahaliea mediterranea]